MLDNLSRPVPPNLSEGCYICAGGMNEILKSKTVGGMSVALCSQHENATSLPPKGQKL